MNKFEIMGKDIGYCDDMNVDDVLTITAVYFQPNELGKKFLPEFEGRDNITIDFGNGYVTIFDSDGNDTNLTCDWSVFNDHE